MRRLIVLFAAAITVLVITGRLGSDSAPEGPVRVVTGDPVRVILPVNASAAIIEQRTIVAVTEATASASTAEMRTELELMAADAATLDWIARTGNARLVSGDAAALAFSLFRVDASGDQLTIYSITVELIPGTGGIAVSRDHEDGHAEVNDQLALRCGPELARQQIAAGAAGALLEASIEQRLESAANEAHDLYHQHVQDASLGTHVKFARDAGVEVAALRCG